MYIIQLTKLQRPKLKSKILLDFFRNFSNNQEKSAKRPKQDLKTVFDWSIKVTPSPTKFVEVESRILLREPMIDAPPHSF